MSNPHLAQDTLQKQIKSLLADNGTTVPKPSERWVCSWYCEGYGLPQSFFVGDKRVICLDIITMIDGNLEAGDIAVKRVAVLGRCLREPREKTQFFSSEVTECDHAFLLRPAADEELNASGKHYALIYLEVHNVLPGRVVFRGTDGIRFTDI